MPTLSLGTTGVQMGTLAGFRGGAPPPSTLPPPPPPRAQIVTPYLSSHILADDFDRGFKYYCTRVPCVHGLPVHVTITITSR